MAGTGAEVIVPFRAPPQKLGVCARVRTTLIVSSLQSLRKRGLYENYIQRLPDEHHAVVRSMIAGQWVPMRVAEAHYDACEALGIERRDVNNIGREVGDRIEGTFLATMVRMAGSVGATPWTALSYVDRLYDRIFAGGGGAAVYKLGPKDAEAHFVGVPLCRIPYFRSAMAGVFEVGAELFCTKAYAKEVPDASPPMGAVLHVAWA
ncbi:MAG TPA: hypothetical protein VMI75_14655 [Polyangiaceae bacterium]|nr:hypothetical protein [Polyangiaceae bacterium]